MPNTNAVDYETELPTPPAPSHWMSWRSWFDPGEPHPYRGPFTRWPHTTDGVLALFVFAASLIAVTVSELGDNEEFRLAEVSELPRGAVVLLALAAAALLLRRNQPFVTTAVVLVIMVGWALAGYGDGQDLALVVAIYSVGRYATNHRQSLIALAAVLAVSVLGSVVDAYQRIDIAPAVAFTAVPWYVGRRIHNRGDYLTLLRERAERLQSDQQAAERRAVLKERSRIARELHDVVAHQVSMMTVQAGAAKTIARNDIDTAIEAMGDVERAGRQALGELRHLLGVLRPDAAGPDELGPQPRLANLKILTDHLVSTGAQLTLTLADLPPELPSAVDLSAYRIVQESVTNIIKHAGPNPIVEIDVRVADNNLVIDVANTIPNLASTLPESGYGIAGMRERASLLGGTLSASPEPPNRYRIQVLLPIELEST